MTEPLQTGATETVLQAATKPASTNFFGPFAGKANILMPLLLIIAAVVAYHNSFLGSFIFDDLDAIPNNATIRNLWPPGRVLVPPIETGVQNRPVANLSFALNYAVGGTNVFGYHFTNLAIHLLGALTLFAIVRRTLRLPALHKQWADAADGLALAVALIWLVHPLATEAVTYIVQRAESLMALFFLLTLYCVIRGVTEGPARRWHVLAVFCCALGMGTKEVMAAAPLVVLLYDRTFLSGSFREALRRRTGLYAGLAATWALLAIILLVTPGKRATPDRAMWWIYSLSQLKFITWYLRLSFWPAPLIMDYGRTIVSDPAQIAVCGVFIGSLIAATVVAAYRKSPLGFLGAWFFIILIPSSSVFPLMDQTMAEKRMYLPLAAVVTLVVLGGYRLFGQRRLTSIGLASLIVATCGILTMRRNEDYRSELAIWHDTAVKCPGNFRAHSLYGLALARAGRLAEAESELLEAVRLQPDHAPTINNLASVLAREGKLEEAVTQFLRVLQLDPGAQVVESNLGLALIKLGRFDEALTHAARALELDPQDAQAHYAMGVALEHKGRLMEASTQYAETLRLRPNFAEARSRLAEVLEQIGSNSNAHMQGQGS